MRLQTKINIQVIYENQVTIFQMNQENITQNAKLKVIVIVIIPRSKQYHYNGLNNVFLRYTIKTYSEQSKEIDLS